VLHRLRERGVDLWTGARIDAIDEDGVRFEDANGAAHVVPADSVVVAEGAEADATFAERCGDVAAEVHAIGDCGGVGYIRGAMEDAARVARAV